MRRILLVCCPVFVSMVLGGELAAEDRRGDCDRLSIATWNVQFLFDGRAPEGGAGFPWKGNPARAREHLERVADVLREVSADIVHLSEVEDLATLERLRVALGDPSYRAYLVEGRDHFTRQNVALLTRIDPVQPLLRSELFMSRPREGLRQGVSKHYVATFDFGVFRLVLIGAHLLAFPEDPKRGARRELQAELLRQLAVEHGTRAGALTCVLGDLNDYDGSLLDAGRHDPQTRVLETLREVERDRSDDDLINTALWLPQARRFTTYHDGDQDRIDDGLEERGLSDHILLSSRLARAVRGVEVVASYPPGDPSDHYPLQVLLELNALSLFQRGDATGDGNVELDDAIAVLESLLGASLRCADAADADDSGRVDISDALTITNLLFLQGEPPPFPGAQLPGIDPTVDALGCARVQEEGCHE